MKFRTRQALYYLLFALASIFYLIATLTGPLGPNRFNLTPTKTHELQLTIILPLIIIWFIAVWGAIKFRAYSQSIINYPDGKAMDMLSRGVAILVLSAIFNSVFGSLRAWAIKDGWLPSFTVLDNNLAIVLPLVAFWYTYKGSQGLRSLAVESRMHARNKIAVVSLLVLIAVAYVFALFHYQYRNNTPDPYKYSSFYLPDGLILLTIAIPYLIAWGFGVMACLNINDYQRQVKGWIYKSALARLTIGILAVIVLSIILQLIVAFSTYFAAAKLGDILSILYLLIILYALGYVVIALGIRRLIKLEDYEHAGKKRL